MKHREGIQSERLYPLSHFQELVGIGRAGMRSMRQQGLRVLRVGRRGFVLGEDFIQFLKQQEKEN